MADPGRETLLSKAIVDISIEGWRFLRAMEHVISELDAEQQRRTSSRCNYFRRQLTDTLSRLELRLVMLDGSKYEPGLAATALNAADFPGDQNLIVDQTIEPIVIGPSGVVRTGTVTLRRALS